MSDHEQLMSQSWASTLGDIQLVYNNAGCEDDEPDREWSSMDELVLCVDTEIIRDVMLGVGGPTRFVRFIFSADITGHEPSSLNEADVKRIEYHDSWGANGVTSITLNDDEQEQMVVALGYMVGIE